MTYVEPSTAGNRSVDTLQDIRTRHGPGNWRVPVAASPRSRVLLYQWSPGTASEAHIHPDADELFVIHEGQATFQLGRGGVDGAAGSIIYVPAGERHSLQATGDRRLLMMIVVSPNVANDATTEGV
jgi:quercetin dioxygenase-like cupin family protein